MKVPWCEKCCELKSGPPRFQELRAKFVIVQSLSCVQHFVAPWTAAHKAPLSSTISQSLLKFKPIDPVMLSNHLILYFSLLFLPSIFPSLRVFSNESTPCIRWLNYYSFSISPSNEYSGLISSRIDWFDILAIQGTLKNLLQHHNLSTSILLKWFWNPPK